MEWWKLLMEREIGQIGSSAGRSQQLNTHWGKEKGGTFEDAQWHGAYGSEADRCRTMTFVKLFFWYVFPLVASKFRQMPLLLSSHRDGKDPQLVQAIAESPEPPGRWRVWPLAKGSKGYPRLHRLGSVTCVKWIKMVACWGSLRVQTP